jgi:ubiquinone/menaquinone biosynthesis C-methylase UbiE
MVVLFPISGASVQQNPEECGFYDLTAPDNYRWMKKESVCFVSYDGKSRGYEAPTLVVRAAIPHGTAKKVLSAKINDQYIDSVFVTQYGDYFLSVPKAYIENSVEHSVVLSVDHITQSENDSRCLGLAVYAIDIINVGNPEAAFDERNLFIVQVSPYLSSDSVFAEALHWLQSRESPKILDIGAGQGWSTALLAAKSGGTAYAVDLIDYSDMRPVASFRNELLQRMSRHESFARSRKVFEPGLSMSDVIRRCHFYTMDATDLLFKNDSFDFVHSLNSFEHINDPEAALNEIFRVLHPGGMAYLQFMPLYFSDAGSHLNSQGLTDMPWAQLLLDRAEIKRLVGKAGKPTQEIDGILDSLNGRTASYFGALFRNSRFTIVREAVHRGFTLTHPEHELYFNRLQERFPKDELMIYGMTVLLKKPG